MAASRAVFASIVLCAAFSTAEEALPLRTAEQHVSSTLTTDNPIPTNLTIGIDWRNVKPDQDVSVNLTWNFDETLPDFVEFNFTVIPEGSAGHSVSVKDKTYELKDLKYYTSYTFVVEPIFKINGELVTKANATVFLDIGLLRPPFGVQIAHLNYSKVLLGWNVDLPRGSNLIMSNLRFGVEYGAQGKPSRSLLVNGTRLELKDLEKSTNYSVTISTMFEGWRNASLDYRFEIMAEDWPAPVLKEPKPLSGEEDPNHAYYEFSFDLPKTRVYRESGFIICEETCRNSELSPIVTNLQRGFNFNSEYNVTVQTVYRLPLNQTVTKFSNVVKGKTPNPLPGPVDFQSIEQQLNKLLLEWKPPQMSRGPVSYYEVNVWDVLNPSLSNTGKFVETHAKIALPHLTNDTYAVTLTAVAKDNRTGEEFRGPEGKENRRTLKLLDPPAGVQTIDRTPNSIRIQVTPSSKLDDILYKAEYAGRAAEFFKSVTLTGFSPFQSVEVNVSSCFLDAAMLPRCGRPFSTQTQSNVDRPFEVGNFTVKANSNNTITLNWLRPSVTNGPLDGYIIHVLKESEPAATLRNFTATSADTYFEVVETEQDTPYNVTIAAYNSDLDSGDPVIGETSSLTVRTPGGGGCSTAVIVLIVLVVVGVAIGCIYLYRRSLQSDGPLMSFSFINNRSNNA